MTERERIVAFLRELDRRSAELEAAFRFGTAYLHSQLPRVWSRNYLVADTDLDEASAELLADEANRILGEAGMRHRKVELYDEEAGARLEPGFRELGWDVHCDVLMVARREPDRTVDLAQAEEVSIEELEPVWAEGIRSEPFGADEEVVRQLVANKRVVVAARETAFFAARINGAIGSYCDLYSDGSTGQIEAVMTLEQFRNRGLARATVSCALAASRAAGHDLTFLMADRDDWPKELYRKLGFDEIGRVYEFVRPAAK
ncbi:MAG TPA: GNAT family N-acetyltransferase [Gaiellaceae bacterium]|nr:GNAT family N-acetyltransferase [Gaiellaceae bacterium]